MWVVYLLVLHNSGVTTAKLECTIHVKSLIFVNHREASGVG